MSLEKEGGMFSLKLIRNNYYKIITIIGIIICITWVKMVQVKPVSDFAYYNELAIQIANGGNWGNTYTSVGYPIVLGFLYSIFGSNLLVAKIFNLFLTLANYLIFFSLLKKVNINENRRKIIYTLFIFFPSNIFYNNLVASEILFTTLLLLTTLIYFSDIKLKYILIGFIVAINTIIKPFFIAFFLVLFITELILKVKISNVIKHTAIVFFVSLIGISPWVYRNTKLVGQFTTISNNGGIVLYINNNSQNRYGRWMAAKEVENSVVLKKEYIQANMTEKNKMLSKAAKKWIVNHPFKFIILGFKRIINTYFIADDVFFSLDGANLNRYFNMFFILYAFLIKLVIFVPAAICIIKNSKKVMANLFNKNYIDFYSLYSLVCFYMFTCVYFITEGQGRYSFPTIFIMIYFFSGLLENKNFYKRKNIIKEIS